MCVEVSKFRGEGFLGFTGGPAVPPLTQPLAADVPLPVRPAGARWLTIRCVHEAAPGAVLTVKRDGVGWILVGASAGTTAIAPLRVFVGGDPTGWTAAASAASLWHFCWEGD